MRPARPSIDPEVLLRILLLGYLYGITSERKLLEELRGHAPGLALARTGLGFDQEILSSLQPFSPKNRSMDRFQQSRVFQELFERQHCRTMFHGGGQLQGEQMSGGWQVYPGS